MVKVRASFTIKPENLALLKECAGIATVSAYLDDLIEKTLGEKEEKT